MSNPAPNIDDCRMQLAMHIAAWDILGDNLESLMEYQDETAEEYQELCRLIQESENG